MNQNQTVLQTRTRNPTADEPELPAKHDALRGKYDAGIALLSAHSGALVIWGEMLVAD